MNLDKVVNAAIELGRALQEAGGQRTTIILPARPGIATIARPSPIPMKRPATPDPETESDDESDEPRRRRKHHRYYSSSSDETESESESESEEEKPRRRRGNTVTNRPSKPSDAEMTFGPGQCKKCGSVRRLNGHTRCQKCRTFYQGDKLPRYTRSTPCPSCKSMFDSDMYGGAECAGCRMSAAKRAK